MKRFACWRASDSYDVINPDADAVEDYVFRAVHTELPVHISSGRAEGGSAVSSREFLEAVLRPKGHAIVPVIGQSGTGKSHLIRWLHLQLRGLDRGREVIYVPKAQTNLRDIVYSLVHRLPGSEQAPYLTALSGTGSANLSGIAQRTAILNHINLALVNDLGGADPTVDVELERFALTGLRATFTDPHVRKTFLADGGFAAEIAAHVFEKPEHYRPAEERREFQERDLPLQVGHLHNAAHATREFLGWLMSAGPAERRAVVAIVNRHLDWAIANCLNLSGDRLIKLMLDLRRHFAAGDKELVLLIEDFARLQGLDRALLQSIIEERPDLCVLRTVFASTVGFYDSIAATIKTRVTFVVDMDLQGLAGGVVLDRFVARYMNAVRWGPSALRSQWGDIQSGNREFAISSRCEECPHVGPCHNNFGAVDGMGLYPFTTRAVATMAERADPNLQRSFNPRLLLKHVLRPTALAADELAAGRFPPATLLSALGGRQMLPTAQTELRRRDAQQWERRDTLLELWGGTQEVRNLDRWIHDAFDLPVLPGVGQQEDAPKEPESEHEPGPAQPQSRVDPRVAELQAWNEDTALLKAPTAQALRDLVFESLRDYVDWDDLGLAKTPFVGSTKGAFKAGQISFVKQPTQPSQASIRLQIPANWEDTTERLRTTMALEGLLEASRVGDWSFPKGLEKLACLLECLEAWGQDLARQCRRFDALADGSDGALLALEARATLQALTGTAGPLTSDEDVLRAALGEFPQLPPDFVTEELSTLVSGGFSVDVQLKDLIRTRFSATKGGAAGDFIDASRCLATVRSLRRRRFLPDAANAPRADKRDLVDPTRQFSVRLSERLSDALRKEAEARIATLERYRDVFGDKLGKQAILSALQRALDIAGPLSIPGTQELLSSKVALEGADIDGAISKLRSADADKVDPRTIQSGVGSVVRILDDVAKKLTNLIGKIEMEVAGRLRDANIDPEERLRLVQTITTDLATIGETLEKYQDGNFN